MAAETAGGMMASDVIFRRIRGRIVPIRQKAGAALKHPVGRRLAQGSAVAVVPAIGVGYAARSTGKNTKGPSKTFLALGYGLQVASGLVAGLPTKGLKGFGVGVAASIGLDTASTAAFVKASADMKGTRKQKIKEYAKHQAIGTAIGYGTFAGALLSNRATRAKAVEWLGKAARWAGRIK